MLPLLADLSKELLRGESGHRDTDALVDVLTPVAYTFPHVAKLLSLSFVPFAAWFVGLDLSVSQYPTLLLTGVVSLFGSINVAMPFLLDLMRLPADLFQLFVATSVLNARFGTLLGAMYILTLTLLVTAALTHGIRWSGRSVVRFALGTVLLVGAVVVGTRLGFAAWIDTVHHKGEILAEMQLKRDAVPAVVQREVPPERRRRPEMQGDGVQAAPPARPRLESIASRGTLRVCYIRSGRVPFAFFNARDELVGLDVEMAHSLARGLEVTLEFVPVEETFRRRRLAEALNAGYCDIGMSQTALSMVQQSRADYSAPYLDLNLAFVVRDHRRHDFAFLERIQRRDDLRIAIPNDPYYIGRMSRVLPRAELVPVDTFHEYLDAEEGEIDALLAPAEIGSAWSLLRPEFTVVVTDPPLQKIPMAYPVPLG